MTVENDVYTPKLDIKSTVSYLSIYSNRDIEKSFLSISDKVSSFSIFSKLPISIPHTAIREENHLLMLKEPKELLGAIFQSD